MTNVRINQYGQDPKVVPLLGPTSVGRLLELAGIELEGLRLRLDGHRVDPSKVVEKESEITGLPRIVGG